MTVAEAVLWIAFGEQPSGDIWKRLDPLRALHMIKGRPTPEQRKAAQAESDAVDHALAELNRNASEAMVTVIGQPMNCWDPNPIAVHAPIEVDYFRSSAIYLDGQARERDNDVSLITNSSRRRYNGLLLLSAEIVAIWPRVVSGGHADAGALSAQSRPFTGTGAPGRPPKSMHLIKPEHAHRIASGKAEATLAAEARHLVEWLTETHPLAPPPTAHTVENQIRDAHRAAHKMKAG